MFFSWFLSFLHQKCVPTLTGNAKKFLLLYLRYSSNPFTSFSGKLCCTEFSACISICDQCAFSCSCGTFNELRALQLRFSSN